MLRGGREGWRAGGVMVQHMPKASPFATGGGSGEGGLLASHDIVSGDDAENWNRVNMLLDTVEEIDWSVGRIVDLPDLLVVEELGRWYPVLECREHVAVEPGPRRSP